MTFEKLIKLLDVLNNEGSILVMKDIPDDAMRKVDIITKYSDISQCMEYFTKSKYSLYIYEKNKEYYEMEEL